MISQADVARTNAIQVGSRIEYRLLMAGRPDDTQQYEALFKQQVKSANGSAEMPAEVQGQEFEEQSSLRLRNASEGNTRLDEADCQSGHFPATGQYSDHSIMRDCHSLNRAALCAAESGSYCLDASVSVPPSSRFCRLIWLYSGWCC